MQTGWISQLNPDDLGDIPPSELYLDLMVQSRH